MFQDVIASAISEIPNGKKISYQLTQQFYIQMREVHQTVVDRLKNSPTSDDVMAYFDPRKKTVLLVDASPVGLGAVLTQDGKVNSYGSKAHSSVEKRYS